MMHKFYKKARYKKNATFYHIYLDDRAYLTPLKAPFVVPSKSLAKEIRKEFNDQKKHIIFTTMPMTQIACTILDKVTNDRLKIVAMIIDYIANDILFYPHTTPKNSTNTNIHQYWQHALKWSQEYFKASIRTQENFMISSPPIQSDIWQENTKNYIENLDDWRLGLLAQAVFITGSFILSSMMIERVISYHHAHLLAENEYYTQMADWGEDIALRKDLNDKKSELRYIAIFLKKYEECHA